MAKEIYISTTPHETRLAIVEDEQLAEIYYERENEYTLAGSIYNGKVTRVLPGMQSAFVDIGLERDAFLYVTDFMEEQGEADFDADHTQKPASSREDSRPEPRAESRGDRRSRGSRERNRPVSEATSETESFQEPIAPHPVEVSAAGETGEEAEPEPQGSRRWRGRRGRRRARGFREGEPSAGSALPAAVGPVESASEASSETFVLEGSSEDAESAHVEEAEQSEELPPTEADAAYALRRSTRREEIRRGRDRVRGGGRDLPQAENLPQEDEAVPSFKSGSSSLSVPFVLPGESLRKYRDPAEVAKEEAAKSSTTSATPQAAPVVSVPSIEIVGWDGGSVLPGETLARHRRQDRPSPVSDVSPVSNEKDAATKQQASAESAVHEDAVPEKPIVEEAAAHQEPVAEPVPAAEISVDQSDAPSAASTENLVDEARHDVAVPGAGEYEPTEGESASLGDGSRRDLRRLEQRAETEPKPPEAPLEELAAAPDASTYDLQASHEPFAEAVPSADAEKHLSEADPQPEHDYTTLQATGEMLSEPATKETSEDTSSLPASQEEPVSHSSIHPDVETSAFTRDDNDEDVAVAAATDTAVDENATETIGQVHAYGEGDLEEEEMDGDEYEYDLALSSLDEEELDEYEEETLDDTADVGSLLHEASADEPAMPVDDVDGREDAADALESEFTVDDFGGEPEESSSDSVASEAAPQERRRGRQDSRKFGRERKSGGFRGGSGGDRGRGRQSVQTMDLPAINELLKPGQEILVQIAKEPIAKKGARITSHIALPGRFLVFMPTVNHTGVSRKISSDEERRRLKSILLSEKGEAQGGFIVRTAAEGTSEEELRNDLRFLIQLWQDIKMRSESSKSPALIYHDLSLVERILRDQVTDNFSAIWVDTETEYERVLRFLQRFQPSLVRRVKLYTKETPLFEQFGVTQEIDKALKSKVWLKSGGSIVINQTEALVAIDINTGKYVGKTARLEDTILKTNLDAIPEIVRQIRLRDLGGIIVIDFIDMDERKNRAKVMQVLEDELKSDRAPSKVLPFNDFGLVIMTRKRVKQSLERTLCIPDPVTEGTGMIKSPVTIANEIYVEMRKMYRHIEKGDVMLRVHPEVVKQLKAAGGKRLQELEDMTHKTILVKSDPALSPEQFDIH